ncbi:hypothetical protein GH714_021559 [Hevea brasiliensis]|uniref:Uncharacterized protein n=1 Tax=Hevea brasiliensis TaxID=3981 RepID=A0A6A6MJV4_HEVBR|nr:hypothetical protein GH714_021559 [Hevea brasiliensis]
MAHHTTRDFFSGPLLSGPASTAIDPAETDLTWPFGDLISLDRDDIRETAYEVFFTACRSSPGFGGGKNAIAFHSTHHHLHDVGDSGGSRSPSRSGSGSSSGGRVAGGPVVVMTPTSRIKQALGLKMLKRSPSRRMSSVMGRRAETIILPLELLRHLKPAEFNDMHEYHLWQRRQLKILEAGLLLHPAIPLEKSNSYAMRLREIIRASDETH